MARGYGTILSAAIRAARMVRGSGIVQNPEMRERVSTVAKQAVSSGMGTMSPNYTWTYRIDVPPYEKLVDVLEAFYASYPGGDYNCEHRDRYKLQFRRGKWRRSLMGLGQLMPDFLAKGRFNLWPIVVRVLLRPSPEVFTTTIFYDLYLPRDIRSLSDEVQLSVDQHVRKELADLCAYLAECIGMPEPPTVVTA